MAVIATDDFNRANGAVGSNWTTQSPWSAMQIVGNRIQDAALGDAAGTYNVVDAGQDDMYTRADVTIITQNINNDCLVWCRMPGDGTETGYYFDSPAYGGIGGGGWTLARATAGTITVMASSYAAGTGIQTGTHSIEVRAVGTTISGYIDGSLITSVTDSTHSGATKRYGGMHIYNDIANAVAMDNFEMGTIGGAVVARPRIVVHNGAVIRSGSW